MAGANKGKYALAQTFKGLLTTGEWFTGTATLNAHAPKNSSKREYLALLACRSSALPVSTSYWGNYPKFAVSYFKAQFGDAAKKENDYGYSYHPKTTGDHSHIPMFVDMMAGKIRVLLCVGQNPAVGGQNARFQRKACSSTLASYGCLRRLH